MKLECELGTDVRANSLPRERVIQWRTRMTEVTVTGVTLPIFRCNSRRHTTGARITPSELIIAKSYHTLHPLLSPLPSYFVRH